MKYIVLSNGLQTKVDEDIHKEFRQYKWHVANGYVARHVSTHPDVREYLHRVVNNTPNGFVTDHINGDKLDNRRSNLRTATVAENAINYDRKNGTKNPYRGVSLHSKSGLWRARISYRRTEITIGYFKSPEEARMVYLCVANQFYGEFAGYL